MLLRSSPDPTLFHAPSPYKYFLVVSPHSPPCFDSSALFFSPTPSQTRFTTRQASQPSMHVSALPHSCPSAHGRDPCIYSVGICEPKDTTSSMCVKGTPRRVCEPPVKNGCVKHPVCSTFALELAEIQYCGPIHSLCLHGQAWLNA